MRCRCLDTESVQLDRKWSDAWPKGQTTGNKVGLAVLTARPSSAVHKSQKGNQHLGAVETKQEALGVCGPGESSGSYLGERMSTCFVLLCINSNSVIFSPFKKIL